MALPILSSSPSLSFIKMRFPYLETKSSYLAIRKSNVPPCQTLCKASYNVSNDNQKIARRSANFKPSIWTDDYIQSLNSEFKEGKYTEKRRLLREEVRMMLCKVKSEIDQLNFIDVLQRLGVDYHFSNEIRNILDNTQTTFKLSDSSYATTLKFRLLRQHGYNISIDCFQDEMGNFNKSKYVDVKEILALYEASFHSFEDETILDEARDFSTKFLKEYLNMNRANYHTALLINHALELPLHWRIPRWEAQWYIDAYETNQNMSPILLQFAKLDFNFVQSIHQEDLKYSSRWWEIFIGDELSFARDRLVESFAWTVGMHFMPGFEHFRKHSTKDLALITVIDDLYDIYGTLEELELFTAAIERWDLNYAMASLPDYMKIYFHAVYNLVSEMAFESLKKNGNYITPYISKAWADLCKSYFIEAKWYHGGYTPTLEEYIENAWISMAGHVVLANAYFLVPHSSKIEDLVHLEEYPNLVKFSSMIVRLSNDLGSYKRENETGDIPKSIQCYMNETGASEVEACEYVNSTLCTMWKKMNKEAHFSSFSSTFIESAVNIARGALYMYIRGDGFSVQDPDIKNRISSLIFQPVNVTCIQHDS